MTKLKKKFLHSCHF